MKKTNPELISRRDLLADLHAVKILYDEESNDYVQAVLLETINDAEEIETDHAKWKTVGGFHFECSRCKSKFASSGEASKFGYCPHCGAVMDEE